MHVAVPRGLALGGGAVGVGQGARALEDQTRWRDWDEGEAIATLKGVIKNRVT